MTLDGVDRKEWATTTVRAIVRDETPHAEPSWTIARAVRAMDEYGCDLLPVIGADGAFIGIVTTADLVRLDEILRATDDHQAAVDARRESPIAPSATRPLGPRSDREGRPSH